MTRFCLPLLAAFALPAAAAAVADEPPPQDNRPGVTRPAEPGRPGVTRPADTPADPPHERPKSGGSAAPS